MEFYVGESCQQPSDPSGSQKQAWVSQGEICSASSLQLSVQWVTFWISTENFFEAGASKVGAEENVATQKFSQVLQKGAK